MTFNQQTVEWAKSKLSALETLRGYPKAEPQVTMYARSLLRIAHPGAVLARWNHEPVTEGTTELSPEELDAIVIESEKHGTVNPMDWLLDAALDRFVFLPAPAELREMFDEAWPVADGVTPKVEVK